MADPPGSNTSKSKDLDSSTVPKDTLYQKIYASVLITPQTDKLDILLPQQLIVIGDLILTEVLQGFRDDKEYQTASQLLQSLRFYDMLGKPLALKTAQNYRHLRKQGITVRKTIDVMIATFCIENDFQTT